MKLGLIADIHANIQALDAVLQRLEHEQVEFIICAGDLVAYGAHPNQVIERLKTLGIPSVMGNYDDAVAWDKPRASRKASSNLNEPLKQAALDWTKAVIRAENKSYLKSLPWKLEYQLLGKNLSVLHAGSKQLDDWLVPGEPLLATTLAQLETDILILGHSHKPFSEQIGKTLVINPGAVGRSLDGDVRAACAILNLSNLTVELLRLPYDLETMLKALRQTEMPREIALLLQHGARRIEEVRRDPAQA